MKKEPEVIYLPMPISIEEKREYNRKGFRVVDARFAPEGHEPAAPKDDKPTQPKKRPLKKKAAEE